MSAAMPGVDAPPAGAATASGPADAGRTAASAPPAAPAAPEASATATTSGLPPDDAASKRSAAERLAENRERMREWMLGTQHRQRARRQSARDPNNPSLVDRLREVPVLGTFIDALSAWWASHPMRPAASLAEGVVYDTVAPVARRHPVAMVAIAMLVGAALVRLRPWRRVLKPALFAGLVSQIAARLVAQVPVDSILAALAGHGGHAPRADAAAAVPEEAAGGTPVVDEAVPVPDVAPVVTPAAPRERETAGP